MKKSMKIYLLILMIGAGTLMASEGDGGYAGAFLRMGIGARAKSLGDAVTALPEDAFAGVYNPAMLTQLKGRNAAISSALLPLDRHLDYIGFAMPLRPKADPESGRRPMRAGLAVAWIRAGVDQIDGRDFSGNHTQDYSYGENAFFLSFALSPMEKFSFGLSGKVLYCRFPGLNGDNSTLSSSGFGVDLGAFYHPVEPLTLGLVLRDQISKNTWNTEKLWERGTSTVDKYPKTLRAAFTCRTPWRWLLLAGDYEDSHETNPRYHAGAEATLPQVGALRLGLDHDHLTFGLGVFVKLLGAQVSVNYAYAAPTVEPGADHIFSWHFVF